MGIDREHSLRRAEKLLRQGRLDAAIEEYLRIIEDQPADWNTVNLLGDLFARSGQAERAAAQYVRIADHFAREGFLSKAIAVYRKVLKVKPDDEHALLQSAEIAARQGLIADAKTVLADVVAQRTRRGDERGAAEIALRLSAIDPADLGGRLQAARAAVILGDRAGAVARFRELAAECAARGRHDEAIAALTEAAEAAPEDAETRGALVTGLLKSGEFARAEAFATAAAEFRQIAAALAAAGREGEAVAMLAEAVRRDPHDIETRVRLVRDLVARGDWAGVAEFVSDGPPGDHRLLFLAVEAAFRAGDQGNGRILLARVAADYPDRVPDLVTLGCELASVDPDAALACVETAVAESVGRQAWQEAADGLQGLITRAPRHIPALNRLVEVCVDGDLAGRLSGAQAALADAWLAAGHAGEARVIAEDLVTREPSVQAHVDLLRRALVALGDPQPDATIAEYRNQESLFPEPAAPFAGESPRGPQPAGARSAGPSAEGRDRLPPAGELTIGPAERIPDELWRTSGAIDMRAIFGDEADDPAKEPPPSPAGGEDAVEIDLSEELGTLTARPAEAPVPGRTEAVERGGPGDLETVFDEFRQEVSRDRAVDAASEHLKIAVMYRQMGMMDEAISALESAARAPRHRFEAASLLGQLHRERGRLADAIEWFERAAETPAPDRAAGHALLYDLADVLERAGETARALAVFLELLTDAGVYRDVAARVQRLSHAQTGD